MPATPPADTAPTDQTRPRPENRPSDRWNQATDDATRLRIVTALESTTQPDEIFDAFTHSCRNWRLLRPLAMDLIGSALDGRLPVTLAALLGSVPPTPRARAILLLSLVEALPDGSLTDDVCTALADLLDESSPISIGERTAESLVRHRRMTPAGAASLLRSGNVYAWTAVARSADLGYVELTRAQVTLLATTTDETLAYELMLSRKVPAMLTSEQVLHLFAQTAGWRAEAAAMRLLQNPAVAQWSDTVVVALLNEAPGTSLTTWLSGAAPVSPSAAVLREVVALKPRTYAPRPGSGEYGADRPVDGVVAAFAFAFTPESLANAGVQDVLDAAPLAVVDRTKDPDEDAHTEPLSVYLLDRFAARFGTDRHAWQLLRHVATETRPATVTDLLDTLAALTR